jgi:hypothetical protein
MSIRGAFDEQAGHCAALGSPFMAQLMSLVGGRLRAGNPVADRILGWPGNASVTADNVPLRLAGALHALRLRGMALEAVYPPRVAENDALWDAVERAMNDHADEILRWLDSPPQTNEVRRSAVILPALALLAQNTDLPVELLELGTSGGLNLRAERFRLVLPGASIGPPDAKVVLAPDWDGPLPPTRLPRILRRAGVDLSPLDPSRPEDELRLLAYLWADQPDRIDRTRAAIAEARSLPAEIAAGDAGTWLARELARPVPDRLRVVLHTIAWQYFPPETRARAEAAMEAAAGPWARISMEFDGGKGAAITLADRDAPKPRLIARADFHGRWVTWLTEKPPSATGRASTRL